MTVNIHHLELLMLLLLLFVVGLAVLARKIGQPYPIVFVLGGLVLSFLPPCPTLRCIPILSSLLYCRPLCSPRHTIPRGAIFARIWRAFSCLPSDWLLLR